MNDEFEIDLPPKAHYTARIDTHLCPECFELYDKEVGAIGRSINDFKVYFPSDVPAYKINIERMKQIYVEIKNNLGSVPDAALATIDAFPNCQNYILWCAKCRKEIVLGQKFVRK